MNYELCLSCCCDLLWFARITMWSIHTPQIRLSLFLWLFFVTIFCDCLLWLLTILFSNNHLFSSIPLVLQLLLILRWEKYYFDNTSLYLSLHLFYDTISYNMCLCVRWDPVKYMCAQSNMCVLSQNICVPSQIFINVAQKCYFLVAVICFCEFCFCELWLIQPFLSTTKITHAFPVNRSIQTLFFLWDIYCKWCSNNHVRRRVWGYVY